MKILDPVKTASKLMEGITYCSSVFACVMHFLNQNAAGIGVLIAFFSLIIGTALNYYWQRKRYLLELKKHGSS